MPHLASASCTYHPDGNREIACNHQLLNGTSRKCSSLKKKYQCLMSTFLARFVRCLVAMEARRALCVLLVLGCCAEWAVTVAPVIPPYMSVVRVYRLRGGEEAAEGSDFRWPSPTSDSVSLARPSARSRTRFLARSHTQIQADKERERICLDPPRQRRVNQKSARTLR